MTAAYDPFKIDSPTCISFSGGRTSAYMSTESAARPSTTGRGIGHGFTFFSHRRNHAKASV